MTVFAWSDVSLRNRAIPKIADFDESFLGEENIGSFSDLQVSTNQLSTPVCTVNLQSDDQRG
jgi:hypothetical protein